MNAADPAPGATLADTLALPPAADERTQARRHALRAGTVLVFVAAALAAWSALAPVGGAVIAAAHVRSELHRKTVQHQEGGIVREVLVREGDPVRAGQPLLVIGDVRTDALLDLQRDQQLSETLRKARLDAELAVAADFQPPPDLAPTPAASEYLARERALFAARRRTLTEQLESLRVQAAATEAQIAALSAQIESTERGAALAREELEMNRDLQRDGYVQRTRVLALERSVADYDSRAGEQRSELALARQRLADLRLRAVQAHNQYRQQAATELHETVTRLREVEERLRPARDQAERQVVRAPVDGTVMSLRVAAAGTVVAPRETLLELVPAQERLVVEARLRPEDIEHVAVGAHAEVRLTAYEYRARPLLPARVVAVSADRVEDARSGAAWYSVQVDLDAAEIAAHPGVRVQAGMPAEVYVATPPRTLYEYLWRPLAQHALRGMREP